MSSAESAHSMVSVKEPSKKIVAEWQLKFFCYYFTPGILVRGSQWLSTKNLYANFWPWLTRPPNVNKRVSSPDLLNLSQFHRHILKNRTVLFPTTFISVSEKIGVGLKKQTAYFLIKFHPQKGSPIFLFWPFFQCKMKVFSAIWAVKYLFNVSGKMYCNLHLRWNT